MLITVETKDISKVFKVYNIQKPKTWLPSKITR